MAFRASVWQVLNFVFPEARREKGFHRRAHVLAASPTPPASASADQTNFHDPAEKRKLFRKGKQPKAAPLAAANHSLLELVFEHAIHGMMITGADGKLVIHNPALLRLFDLPPTAMPGPAGNWLEVIAPQVKEPRRLRSFFEQIVVLPVGETLDIFELCNGRLVECHTALLDDPRAGTVFRLWTFVDCTERQRRERELTHLSTHDTLTSAYNRAYFEMKLNQFRLHGRYPVSMIMLDVDGLKRVNDAFGHAAGDELLRQAASILRHACRVDDIVARLGGDEFGMLLVAADSDVAEQVTARVHGLLNLYNMRHPETPISLSFGMAVAQSSAELDDLVARADGIMYRERRIRRSGKAAESSAV